MSDAAPILIADKLTCDRGGRRVLADVSFQVAAGGALLVKGPNGAGKSTLLRLVAGLLRLDGGVITNPFETAFLGHDNGLKSDRSLASELNFWARLDGRADRVAAALERFDLAVLADFPVRILSSGQKRRVALARTWASGARLWLLDEPSVGLDTANVERLAGAMRDHRAGGGLVIATSHVPIGLDDAAELLL